MNLNRTLCISLLLPLLLLSACGEESQTERPVFRGPDSLPRLPEFDPTTAFPDYNPEDKEAFEEAVFRQHGHLMGQVSKKVVDSIMQVHLLGAKDIKSGKEKAGQELKKWMERQDTLARNALAAQFAISRDSVDAILKGRVDE